jgi:hypothetical protein
MMKMKIDAHIWSPASVTVFPPCPALAHPRPRIPPLPSLPSDGGKIATAFWGHDIEAFEARCEEWKACGKHACGWGEGNGRRRRLPLCPCLPIHPLPWGALSMASPHHRNNVRGKGILRPKFCLSMCLPSFFGRIGRCGAFFSVLRLSVKTELNGEIFFLWVLYGSRWWWCKVSE